MADSIRERIIDDIVTTLQTISVENGYRNDLPGGVSRFEQDGASVAAHPGVIVTMASESKESVNIDMMDCTLEVAVEVFAIDTGEIDDTTAGIVDSLTQDVEKALSADPQRSGLCTDSFVTTISPFGLVDGQPFVGVLLSYTARYRHDRKDSTIAR